MATLLLLGKDDPFPLDFSQIGIGRANDNEIVLDDESVSAFHALVTVLASTSNNDNEYVVEDLESTNKTYVNGKAVNKQSLREGDIIRVGQTRLKFSLKDYVTPQQDFQKTTKLNQKTLSKYLGKK